MAVQSHRTTCRRIGAERLVKLLYQSSNGFVVPLEIYSAPMTFGKV